MKYPPKSGVVLFDSFFQQVLLVKNNYGDSKTSKWGLPKGHLEKNESFIDGGHREFHEETGLYINKSNYKSCEWLICKIIHAPSQYIFFYFF